MKTYYCKRLILPFFFIFISFQSFCQFGERQVIHEDADERQDYRFIGAFDFDNDDIEELWYVKNPTELSQEHVFFKLVDQDYVEISIPNSDDWFEYRNNFFYSNGPLYKVVDYNSDGYNDIVFFSESRIHGITNEQNFSFTEPIVLIEEFYFVENFENFEPIDVNQDGALDLISMNVNEVIVWAENDGNGNFSEPLILIDDESRFVYPELTSYDLNKDGVKEIIIPGFDNIEIFSNNRGSLQLLQSLDIVVSGINDSYQIVEYLFSDLNSDGNEDLIILRESNEGVYLNYYFNDGNKFLQINELLIGSLDFPWWANNLKIADLDDDGDNDFLIDLYAGIIPSEEIRGNNWFEGTAWIENIDGFNETKIHYQFSFNYRARNKIKSKHAIDLYNNGSVDIPSLGPLNWIEINNLIVNDYRKFNLLDDKIIGDTYDLKAFKNSQDELLIAASFDNEFAILSDLFDQVKFTTINTHYVRDQGYLDVIDINEDGLLDLITIHDQLIGTDQFGGVMITFQ